MELRGKSLLRSGAIDFFPGYFTFKMNTHIEKKTPKNQPFQPKTTTTDLCREFFTIVRGFIQIIFLIKLQCMLCATEVNGSNESRLYVFLS